MVRPLKIGDFVILNLRRALGGSFRPQINSKLPNNASQKTGRIPADRPIHGTRVSMTARQDNSQKNPSYCVSRK